MYMKQVKQTFQPDDFKVVITIRNSNKISNPIFKNVYVSPRFIKTKIRSECADLMPKYHAGP